MKVIETKVKKFNPYKISIKISGTQFVLDYWIRKGFTSLDSPSDYVIHSESFETLQGALERFNEVIKEIKIDESKRINQRAREV